jgi:uncharacterized membrane protein YccC
MCGLDAVALEDDEEVRALFRTVRRASGRLAAAAVLRIRQRGRSAFARAVRLTGAAVAAYLVAEGLGFRDPPPLIAALTALIVVQVTLSSTLTNGLQRVLSVVAGVTLAVLVASVVGLTWWSLGGLVAASIVVGQLLRLGPHLVEVPISAMLVLGVGGAESAAAGRIIETVVGAVVGVLVNVVLPPAVQTRYAGRAVEQLAEEIAGLLDEAAASLVTGLSVEQATRWLEDARRLNRHVPRVDRALAHAEESRRLNVRALRTPETGLSLRGRLAALEHCSIGVRTLFRSIYDAVQAGLEQHGGYVEEARRACSVLLDELATVVRAFGRLVRAEVEASAQREEAELASALEVLRVTRVREKDLLLADPREHPALWELNSALLVTIDRMLLELDAADPRLRDSHRREAVRRGKASQAVDRLRTTTRWIADRPRQRRTPDGSGTSDSATEKR